ncbi:hypothetical protein M0802_004389 [Mischocyttarus mexicanus]|nr:hypothetical protein M0802_004389 [Mischocyttarus mexicanus]
MDFRLCATVHLAKGDVLEIVKGWIESGVGLDLYGWEVVGRVGATATTITTTIFVVGNSVSYATPNGVGALRAIVLSVKRRKVPPTTCNQQQQQTPPSPTTTLLQTILPPP